MITIIDYGMGNLGSILNMFKRINIEAEITSDKNTIESAQKLLLPGVGAFDAAMKRINESGLRDVLDYKAMQEKVPILGICLGMQLLTNSSEEGKLSGLGWIPGQTKRFEFGIEQKLKIPHMGWNLVREINKSALTFELTNESRFYFVHSYYVKADNIDNVLMRTHFGFDFDSVVQKENIYGAQFHPEKSHKYGMKLLQNFSVI